MSSLVTGSVDADGDVGPAAPAVVHRRRWPIITWGLLVGWVVLLVATAVLGARPTSWEDLQAGVASGDVGSIEIVGGLSARAQGSSVTEVRWRDGVVGRVATVIESHPLRAAQDDDPRGRPVVSDVAAALTDLRPGLVVDRGDGHPSSSGLLGWSVPDALLFPQGLLAFFTLCQLAGAADIARLPRWGWFLLLLVWPAVGVAGFLLMGAPGAPLRPRKPRAVPV